MEMETEAAVGFRKKAKRAGGVRKRAREALEEEPQVEETLQTIEEVLEDQRLRASKHRGTERAESKSGALSKTETTGKAEVQYGIHDPKKDGTTGEKLLHLLDGQFTGQTGATQQEQHQELMNKYIDERLRKTTETPQQPDGSTSETPHVTDEDALYADLRQQLQSEAKEEDASDGGVLIWNTGIAEVDLPSSYLERTVHETKKALEHARDVKSRRVVASSALPNNFSVDFNRHRSEYIQEMKALSKDERRERGFVAQGRKDRPSDDLAVSRFRRMESRKRHR